MLVDFLQQRRTEILALTESKTLELAADHPSSEQLKQGLPIFYEQLIGIIRRAGDPAPEKDPVAVAAAADRGDEPAMAKAAGQAAEAEIARAAGLHGVEYLRLGYTLSHVVHAYGAMCQAITEIASESATQIESREFHALNRCLDVAIAGAVTAFERAHRTDGDTLSSTRQQMLNVLGSARAAFHVLRGGTVGAGGSTGSVLERSLDQLQGLIERLPAARTPTADQ